MQTSPIIYWPKTRVFGLVVLNGPKGSPGTSIDSIHYCPFTGRKLPTDLVDMWFDKLEMLGLEPDDPDIPKELLSETWWVEEKL